MKKILAGGVIVLVAGIIFVSLVFLSGTTDPTPPQVRAGWYLPHQDIAWTVPEPTVNESRQERLVLNGWQDAPAPQFPALSPYSRYENYTDPRTTNKYMIATWYFTDERTFVESQKKLNGFLQASGNFSPVELNFTGHIAGLGQPARGIQDPQSRYTLPPILQASGYESGNTSGYFFTVTIPGSGGFTGDTDYSKHEEYYLVYYGTTTPTSLTSQAPFLKGMIAETCRFDRVARMGDYQHQLSDWEVENITIREQVSP
ncbi:hypothetical protein [Methanoregula sp.]|uniref:hypothetical protein n=1 Tax=Methanoregula sp. TaxID=2052170 RepID=UPI003561B2E7